ncbi:uncharacterized protein LOC131047398 isoform X3 [Cryptomeria japonica]|uniref:uncharacterized protein LOC131047398 isoform X3 n=1 Tax=Cryptomeria japonica TaxID=3369 RepID=UPI0027DA95A0|nr:uncharacterized protein LOC131047398 isoform X3 [Cryptomeria japonica]
MGDHEGWAQPNGLLPGEAAFVTRHLDPERWTKAEERTAELIACIQPNQPSEERRTAVADYVERLIHKCFECQVFTFGSVPLKTYLPDGDIDLTAFSYHQSLKDTWANEVRDVLESEEKSEHAKFHVKEVQYIQAEVDHLIGQNYLFKRSIILVKAWCYYESRILGAHHGLISTYALETLVLYIFHVFNKSFSGPLEVLYRFLAFFSNFDWDNYCVSLWGPIPLSSLPDMTAEPPRKDGGKLLLDKEFLDACHHFYAVYPVGQENQGQSFVSKHFNVVDPLRISNNLGRSVSKGNFFRIRSAFGFGARKLARILECPKECIISEIDQFFMNTWERHGSGQRPDAPSPDVLYLQPSRSDSSDSVRNNRSLGIFNNDDEENTGKCIGQLKMISDRLLSFNIQGDGSKHVQGSSSPLTGLVTHHAEDNSSASSFDQEPLVSQGVLSKHSNTSEASKIMTNRYHDQQSISDKSSKYSSSERNATKTLKGLKVDTSRIDSEEKGRLHIVRPHSSPELTGVPSEIPRARRIRGEITDAGRNHASSVRIEHAVVDRRRKNMSSDSSSSLTSKATSVNESVPLRWSSSQENIDSDDLSDSQNGANIFFTSNDCQDAGLDVQREEVTQPNGTMAAPLLTHKNMQDPVNLMGIPHPQFVNRQASQIHLPVNFAPVAVPISPSVFTSMAYGPANLSGMVHTSLPLTEPAWGPGGQPASYSNIQFPQGVPSALPPYLANVGIGTQAHLEDSSMSEKLGVSGSHHEEEEVHYDTNFCQRLEDQGSQCGHAGPDMKNGRAFHLAHSETLSTSLERPASPRAPVGTSTGLFLKGQNKLVKDVKGLPPVGQTDFPSAYSPPIDKHDNGELSQKALTTSSQEISSSRTVETWTGATGRVSKYLNKKARGRGNNNVDFSNSKLRDFSSSGKSNINWQLENRMDGTRAGDETSNQDKHLFGAANASSLNHGDRFMPPLHGSRSAIQTAFYPTGPPFPFFTMLPVYNFSSEGVSNEESSSPFEGVDPSDDSFDNRLDQPEHCLDISSAYDLGESSEHSYIFPCSNIGAVEGLPVENRDEMKPHIDILQSDIQSHWRNLQYGRFCQNPRIPSPMIYPSPVPMPLYLQSHLQWDSSGRPLSNMLTQFVSYGHGFVPVSSLQPNSNRPSGNVQRFNAPNRLFGEELPRYRGGTGTYLPNIRPYRERQSSGSRGNRVTYGQDRNDRGSYGQDRNDHGDQDAAPKNRSGGRGQNKHDARNQPQKSNSRGERNSEGKIVDRVWDYNRHDNFRRSSYQVPHAPFASGNSSLNTGNFMPHMSGGMSYGMYPLQPINTNVNVQAIPGNGPAVSSVVMLYHPCDNSMAFMPDPLEFGSLRPGQFGEAHEGRYNDGGTRVNDGHVYEPKHNSYQANSSSGRSPSDQPSSPKHQRSPTQHSYQLTEEDFPPLKGGSNSFNAGNNSNNRGSHYQAFLVTPSS